ncbi:MAG: YbjQ family protein [Candidatus Poseidoniaceae archaeon]
MSELINTTPVWLLMLYGLIFLFSAFFPAAFIYSMLFGGLHESKRLKKLVAREQRVAGISGGDNIHTLSKPINIDKVSSAGLVMTNITVSPSWWQLFLGNIKSLFGGQIKSYDKVLAYGRAEVLQRLREQALGEGWTEIINVRVETSMVMNKVKGGQQNKIGTLEFLAFGTGIK